MDVTLEINGIDFSQRLSTYRVEQDISAPDVLTTINGTEYYGKTRKRDIVYFSLLPFSDDQAKQDYDVLTSNVLYVTYTMPMAENQLKSDRKMKVTSNLSAAFGLRSVNGLRYYKGETIVLRATNTE